MIKSLEKVVAVVMVTQSDVNRCPLGEGREQLFNRLVIRQLTRQAGRVSVEDDPFGPRLDYLRDDCPEVFPREEFAVLVLRIGWHVRVRQQSQVERLRRFPAKHLSAPGQG